MRICVVYDQYCSMTEWECPTVGFPTQFIAQTTRVRHRSGDVQKHLGTADMQLQIYSPPAVQSLAARSLRTFWSLPKAGRAKKPGWEHERPSVNL